MQLFRNPELRWDAVCYGVLTLVLTAAGAWFSKDAAWIGLVSGLLCAGLHFAVTARRYARLRALSHALNEVLNGAETLSFDTCEEGELAILQSELQKLMISLSNQRNAMSDERKRLSDAMTDISHQLRTPLTAMNLNISLLGKPDLTPERRRALLRELTRMTQRLDWLCVTLLRLAQLDAGTVQFRKERASLRKIAEKAAEPLAIAMELRGQTFGISGDAEACVDESWMVEAVSNLLKNCMEHTPSGGRVWVELTENPIYAEIIVQDTGAGFRQEDLPRLFERFYRGQGNESAGFGVGLTLARRIFAAQDGTLKAENRQGAAFVGRIYGARAERNRARSGIARGAVEVLWKGSGENLSFRKGFPSRGAGAKPPKASREATSATNSGVAKRQAVKKR